MIELGESVTWRARHFGVVQELTSVISEFERPIHFQDRMVEGAFASFVHDHDFEATAVGTKMVGTVQFAAPLGVLGRLAEALFLRRYLRRLLEERGPLGLRAKLSSAPSFEALLEKLGGPPKD